MLAEQITAGTGEVATLIPDLFAMFFQFFTICEKSEDQMTFSFWELVNPGCY